MLSLVSLFFAALENAQADDSNVSHLDDGQINYQDTQDFRDAPVGTVELIIPATATEPEQHIMLRDASESIIIRKLMNSTAVSYVQNSLTEMLRFGNAANDAIHLYSLGQSGPAGFGNGGSSGLPPEFQPFSEHNNFNQPPGSGGGPLGGPLPGIPGQQQNGPEVLPVIQQPQQPPQPVPDTKSINAKPDESVSGNVLDNDSVVGGTLTITTIQDADENVVVPAGSTKTNSAAVITGLYGTLKIGADGSYDYVVDTTNPTVKALGQSDSIQDNPFTYTVTDGTTTAQTTLTITVNGVNDAPVANVDTNWAKEDTSSATGNVLQTLAHDGAPSLGPFSDHADTDIDNGTVLTVTNIQDADENLAVNPGTTSANGAVIHGKYGTLTIGANGSYNYVVDSSNHAVQALGEGETLVDNAFTYTVTDGATTETATLIITVFGTNSAPVANADTNWAIEGTSDAIGNVLQTLPHNGAPSSGTFSDQADTDVDVNDILTVTNIQSSSEDLAVAPGTNSSNGTLIDGVYGTLTIGADGSYSYHPKTNISNATDVEEVFTYTVTDGKGPTTATLTITISDGAGPTVSGAALLTVDEAALDTIAIQPDILAGLVTGSNPSSTAETAQSGGLTFAAGSDNITGVVFSLSAQPGLSGAAAGSNLFWVINGSGQLEGHIGTSASDPIGIVLAISGPTTASVGGTVSPIITATLTDNFPHAAGSGQISITGVQVVATDTDGDMAAATVEVSITDDAPTAVADTDSIAAAGFAPATGNVLLGGTDAGDANTTDGNADTQGADGAVVSGVAKGTTGVDLDNVTTVGTGIHGQFGTLTINADGTYNYVRDPASSGGVNDVFTYTIKDGDGDLSHTTLTISIGDSTPSDVIPPPGGATTTVFEKGLPPRGSEPAGSGESADGNPNNNSDPSEATSGTISFTSPDGVSLISLGGHALSTSPQTFADGTTGSLTASYSYNAATGQGTISYSYTLLDNTLTDPSNRSFAVVVTDTDGDSAPAGNLVINVIDDAPTAVADTDSIAAAGFAPATGNVLLGGTDAGDANTTDGNADTQGADGAVVSGVAKGTTGVDLDNVTTVGTGIHGQFGTLTINADGTYNYVRDPASSGGVNDVFTYTIKDGDGDLSHTTLTISIGDSTPSDVIPPPGGATTTVFEKGLPPRGSEPAGSGESADGNPNNNSDPSEATSGTISFTSPDGVSLISLGGHALSTSPQTFADGTTGSLTASYSYNAATGQGTISYSYTLLDNTLTDPSNRSFAVVVTDTDGDSAPAGNLVINVIDDAPTAVADTDSIAAAGFAPATGNVLLGGTDAGDANTTDGNADTQGADGAVVSGVAKGTTGVDLDNVTTVGTGIHGQFGTLTINADGTYNYVRDPASSGGVNDVFTYTIKDGDGDLSHTTLTISIGDSTPSDVIPPPGGATTTVFEKGLPPRGSEPAGSGESADGNPNNNSDPSEATSGTISFTSPDGVSLISLGGHALSTSPQTFADGTTGSLTASYSYNAATGQGTISYSYTLLDNTLTDPSNRSFAVVVTDTDGDSAPAGNLVINVIDDAPTAVADTDSIAAAGFAPATGNVLLGGTDAGDANTTDGNADTQGADGAVVSGVAKGTTGVDLDNVTTVGTGIHGQFGTLTINADGTYNYVRDPASSGGVNDVFTYTIKDGDGDLSHTTLTISIGDSTPSDVIPPPGGATTTVFEKGLPPRGSEPAGSGESADGNPNNNSDPSEATSGTISFTSPDGVSLISLGGHALSTSPQTFADGTTGSLTASYSYNAATGQGTISYSYTLLDNTLTDPSNRSFAVVVTDTDGDSAPAGNLVINVIDDAPTAVPNTRAVPEGTLQTADVQFIVDLSGSMYASSGGGVGFDVPGFSDDRIGLARYSMQQLLVSNDQIQNVQIIRFGDSASGTLWLTKADALAFIQNDSNWNSLGGTDYDAALQQAINSFGSGPASSSQQSIVYFMSDGAPTTGGGITSDGSGNNVSIAEWESHVTGKGIDQVFAIGIGNGVNVGNLEPIAYPNTDVRAPIGDEDNVILVSTSNVVELPDRLQDALEIHSTIAGNILLNDPATATGADSFGADGGRILSIKVGNITYTYDPVGNDISASSGPQPTQNTPVLTVTTALGGTFTFYFATSGGHVAGDWSYLTGTAGPESFSYVLVDGDGDQATAALSINVLPLPPNQAPAGADHTVNLVEDVSYTFGISDFGFSDVDGNSFAGVVINTLPSGSDGVLRLGNTPIAAGTVITVDQIKDGGLIYTPVDNVIGNAGDGSFTFSVRDGGGTANGGVNTDPSPNTITLDMSTTDFTDNSPSNGNNTITTTALSGANESYQEQGGSGDSLRIDTAADGSTVFINLDFFHSDNNLEVSLTSGAGSRVVTAINEFGGSAFEVSRFDDGGTYAGYSLGNGDYNLDQDLSGGNSNDIELGTAGNDSISGGSGNDLLFGNGGGDTLTGGNGADLLIGGSGHDTFVISSGQSLGTTGGTNNNGTLTGYDVIADFDPTVDKLDLNGTPTVAANTAGLANPNGSGNNSTLTIGGVQVSQHSITNGIITFYNDSGSLLTLTSLQNVAAVVQYLHDSDNDLGNSNVTVAFNATIDGVAHTFIDQQVGNSPSAANDILIDLYGVTLNNLSQLITNGVVDPIVLDLGTPGISFTSLSNGVSFDINGDGVPDQVAWTAGNDGILAYDVNGSGTIENGNELFTPNFAGGNYASGLAALASLDSNGDGVINSADADFGKLLVWQDTNHDGIADAGELSSLADHGHHRDQP